MEHIIGQTPPPNLQQPSIDISQTSEVVCLECGDNTFFPALRFRKVSRILTGTPEDAVVPVEVYVCSTCGRALRELLPKQLQNLYDR